MKRMGIFLVLAFWGTLVPRIIRENRISCKRCELVWCLVKDIVGILHDTKCATSIMCVFVLLRIQIVCFSVNSSRNIPMFLEKKGKKIQSRLACPCLLNLWTLSQLLLTVTLIKLK